MASKTPVETRNPVDLLVKPRIIRVAVATSGVSRSTGLHKCHARDVAACRNSDRLTRDTLALQDVTHQFEAYQRVVERHQALLHLQRQTQHFTPAVGDPAAVV